MSGFVYIWLDRKKNRYYVGSHWGEEDDGYVCSSTWMKQAYAKRPQDFKRRILERFTDRSMINQVEHRWLQMIKPEELGERYYNLRNYRFGDWPDSEASRVTVSQKISNVMRTPEVQAKLRSRRHTPETRTKISDGLKGKVLEPDTRVKLSLARKGRKHSPETRAKMAAAKRGKSRAPFTPEHRARLSEARRRTTLT